MISDEGVTFMCIKAHNKDHAMAEGGNLYSTHQMKVIVTLQAMGHRPVRVQKDSTNKLVYYFKSEAGADADKIMLDSDSIQVSVASFWAAYEGFKLAMRQSGL